MATSTATAPEIGIGIDDLDGSALRVAVGANASGSLVMARDRYALAYQWCITHPPVDDADHAVFGQARLPGQSDCDIRVGGDGTPGIAAFAAEEYAALAGVTVSAGLEVLSNALDLHHRLPRLWAQVEALQVPAWKAARVADLTHRFSCEAAAWVDDRLHALGRYGWTTIDAAIKQATAMFHPDWLKRDDGLLDREDWDVTLDHGPGVGGTSKLEAVGDSVDLTKFHDLVCDEATALGRLGDTDALGQRKAKALGVLADRQATLDLSPQTPAVAPTEAPAEAGTAANADRDVAPVRRSYLKTRLYLHLSLTDLVAHQAGDPTRVGDAGRLGPQLVAQIEDWLAACGSDARVTPVIDLNRDWAVDRHDPPEVMREQVILRDRHCVFPYCTRDARTADLDHIDAYDPNGPPGQTNPTGLAPLCRRHHRLKTFTGWTYHRDTSHPDTDPDAAVSYLWTSPYGERWRVTPGHQTARLDQPDPPDQRRQPPRP